MAKDEKTANDKAAETAAESTPTAAPPVARMKIKGPEHYPQFLGNEEWERQMAAKRGEVRTAEQWAEAKGMLPEFIPLPQPFARADAPVVMQHNPQSWRYAATRAGSGWPIGKELTEAEFDAAVTNATTGHQYR